MEGTITKEQLKANLDAVLNLAAFLTTMTPKTKIDDAIVAALRSVADQDWLLDVLLGFINKKLSPDDLKKALASLPSGCC